MADHLSREFRAQLNTAMETLIRTAVFEITQIFENSVHDHQVELAQKGEEVALLKVKLQRAEIRLRDILGGGAEMSKNLTNETQKVESEDSHAFPQQPSAVPEIDFEVPDEWCIPLSSENVTRQDNSCPSVRLRQFSIPLCPILIKQEKTYHEIEKPRPKKRGRKSKKGKTSAKKTDKSSPKNVERSQRLHVNTNVKTLLMNIKQEFSKIREPPMPRKKISEQKQETCKVKTAKTDEMVINDTDNTFPCKFCSKVFDTVFGLNVHIRAHKKCKGCKKIFNFPSRLGHHKAVCAKYKELVKVKSSNVPSSQYVTPSMKQEIIAKEKPSLKERSTSGKMHNEKLTCTKCYKVFSLYTQLKKHSCVRTGEQIISCEICPRKFASRKNLKLHVVKMHKESTVKQLDLSWTKPLEEIEDSRDTNRTIKNMTGNPRDVKKVSRSGPVVVQSGDGFKCVQCKQVFKQKYYALEHAHSHTGERQFKCPYCDKKFVHRQYLSVHRRLAHGVTKYTICACRKRFALKSKYKEHKVNCPKAVNDGSWKS